jgi:enamine deaminase RidA (YjgF/YER057c/UK114 family)
LASPFPPQIPQQFDPGQQQDPGSFADQIRAALDKIRAAIASDGPSDQDR